MIQKIDRAAIKAQARRQLQGKTGVAFLCMLVSWLISAAASQIPTFIMGSLPVGVMGLLASLGWLLSLAISIFVTMPLQVGYSKVCLNITYGYEPSVGTLFEPFSKNYKNSVLTSLLVAVYEFLWYLPFCFIAVILSIVAFMVMVFSVGMQFLNSLDFYELFDWDYIFNPLNLSTYKKALVALGVVYLIILLLMIPYAIIINAYAQSVFVLCEYPSYTPSQCVDASRAMMRGRKWELFVLTLSFIPWMLLVAVTLGLGIIYVGPYMSVTYANYYHKVKEGFVGLPAQNPPYGPNQPYGPQYGQPYGQPAQPGASPYGSNVPYGQPQAPAQPADDPFARFAARSGQPKSESEQVLDQVSHDMMTNFDDYTDANPNGPIQPTQIQPGQPAQPIQPTTPADVSEPVRTADSADESPVRPAPEAIAVEPAAEESGPAENESANPATDVDQALEEVSHNMMNNFDDFTDDEV